LIFVEQKTRKTRLPNHVEWNGIMTSLFVLLASLAVLLFAGKITVDSSIVIARTLGLSEFFIAVIPIAVGTSLPELFVNIRFILTKNQEIVLGNILGSLVVNITIVLGIPALITTVPTAFSTIGFSLLFFAFITFIVMFSLAHYKGLTRNMGLIMVLLYIFFLISELLGSKPF
jgi:cation:H+ antiporter